MKFNKNELTSDKVCFLALFLVIFLPLNTLSADGAAFVKFEGIKGESLDKDHQGWSDLLGLNQTTFQKLVDGSTSLAGSSGSGGLISVIKSFDKASPKIAESLSTGKILPMVEIQICKNSSDRVCYYNYKLENVMISSYSVSGTTDSVPIEEISFNFEQIKITYSEIKQDGTIGKTSELKWNVLTGETSSVDSIPLPSPSDFDKDSRMDSKTVESDIENLEIESKAEEKIPEWIKNNARWWADNQILDSDFVLGIQYLVQEKIIVILSLPEQASEQTENSIPEWVRNNADWWSDNLISEEEFLNAIKYLIEQGIIRVGN